jgi:hypothetical protein
MNLLVGIRTLKTFSDEFLPPENLKLEEEDIYAKRI